MIPDLPEIPAMEAASASSLNLMRKMAERLPGLPPMDANPGSMANNAAEEAEKLANELRVAYGITRNQNRVNSLRAKAKERVQNRRRRNANKQYEGNTTKAASRNIRSKDRSAMRTARERLGIGTDLFRNVRLG